MGYNVERQIRRGHAEYQALIHKTTARYNAKYGALKRRPPGETKADRAAAKVALEAEKVSKIAEFTKKLKAIHPTGGWAIGSDINVLCTLADMMDESKDKLASPTNPGGTRKGFALQCTIWNRSGESSGTTKAVLKRARERGMVKSSSSRQGRSCLDYQMPDVWQAYYAARDNLLAAIEEEFAGTVAADFYDEEAEVNEARDAEEVGTSDGWPVDGEPEDDGRAPDATTPVDHSIEAESRPTFVEAPGLNGETIRVLPADKARLIGVISLHKADSPQHADVVATALAKVA